MARSTALPLGGLRVAQRVRLVWCLLAVVAGHALMAASLSGAASAVHAGPQRLQVRLVSSADPLRDHGGARPALNPEPRRSVERPAAAAALPVAVPVAVPVIVAPASADEIYLPREALTRPPKSSAPVNIDYPYFDGESEQYTGEFDLFIDDTGSVVRVTAATPDLPGILANAVRDAFLTARFVPGELEGRPVRSRLRIEVTFDSRRPASS